MSYFEFLLALNYGVYEKVIKGRDVATLLVRQTINYGQHFQKKNPEIKQTKRDVDKEVSRDGNIL